MKCFSLLLLIIRASLFVSSQQDANNTHALNLGVFLSINSSVRSTAGFLPALDIAIDTVNNHTEVLKNLNGTSYTLNVILNDSRCDAPTSLRGFIDQIFFEPVKIMLIGASCSISTEPLAELSPYWNLVQISPAATSPRLSTDASIFPKFLRTVSNDSVIVPGVAAVMQNFGWSRIALLTQTENVFTFFANELRDYFEMLRDYEGTDLQVTHEFQFNTNGNVDQIVEPLRNSPARIVFINMYPQNALEVMCLAYQKGLFYPGYVYMFHNWYSNDWWRQPTPNCDTDQIQSVLEFSLLFGHYPRIPDDMRNVTNVGNLTFEEYEIEYNRRLQNMYPEIEPGTSDLFDDSVYVFDAVWAAALALHNTSKAMNNQTLMDFDYNNGFIANILYEQALKTDFFGLSGNVNFDSIGDRRGFVRFLQYRRDADTNNVTKVIFGQEVGDGNGFSYLVGETVETVHPRGVPQDEEHVYISEALFVVYTVFSCIGIVFACVSLGFNLLFRNRPYVKNSTPYATILVVVGAIILYATVILFGMDENIVSSSTVDGLCHSRVWLSVVGFSLLFGTIFAKAWRIYYINKHLKSETMKEINDLYLFLIVGVLILIDIVFMIFPTAIENSRLQRHEKEIGSDDNDGRLPMIIGVCDADMSLEWLSVLFVYKGVVLLAGLFVAFESRKVTLVSLNESRYVAMSIYGAIIVSIALTPIGLLLEEFPNAQYGILGIMIILCVTIILGLVFVTKMYKLYKDPTGEHILMEEKPGSDKQKSSDNIDYSDGAYRGKVETLNSEIFQLRNEIQQIRHRSKNNDNSTNGVHL